MNKRAWLRSPLDRASTRLRRAVLFCFWTWLLQKAVELDDSAGGAVAERRVGEEALRGAAAARQPPGLVSGGWSPSLVGVELEQVVRGGDQSPFGAAC